MFKLFVSGKKKIFTFTTTNIWNTSTMGKEKSVKKEEKKAPAKTQKEKKEAKKLKKLAKGGL